MYVLVVDDEVEIADLVVLLLRSQGVEARRVCNGEDALQVISFTPVDLVITDLMMPGVDGAEVVRRLRSISNAPVVLMSALSEAHALAACPPVDAFLQKPFTGARLRQAITLASRNRSSRRAHDSDTAAA